MRDKTVCSKYSFLINSNQPVTDQSPRALRRMNDFLLGLKRVFLSPNIINFILIKDEEDKQYPKPSLLSKIDADVSVEIGPEKKHLHAHVVVTIHHRTTVMLETNRVGRFIMQQYGHPIYVSPPKIIPDNTIALVQYSEKQRRKIHPLIIRSAISTEDGNTEFFNKQF